MNQPLVDEQAWRQTDTAAIARNYFSEGGGILYPRVDWRGDTPGYVEMEFPLFPFVVGLIYSLLGHSAEWVGRLLSALPSAATVPLLYAFGREFFNKRTAALACLIFALSPLDIFWGGPSCPKPR